MANDGYEMIGPGRGPVLPNQPAPSIGPKPTVAPPSAPPLPPRIIPKKNSKRSKRELESESSFATPDRSVLEQKTDKGGSKSVMRSSEAETSRMESTETTEMGIHQRPNACDISQLAGALFFGLIVIAVAVPVILAATGNADIDWISSKLEKL